jgi:hypothetical protein
MGIGSGARPAHGRRAGADVPKVGRYGGDVVRRAVMLIKANMTTDYVVRALVCAYLAAGVSCGPAVDVAEMWRSCARGGGARAQAMARRRWRRRMLGAAVILPRLAHGGA